jgi:hypothetical protein
MKGRTVREFSSHADLWALVENWAAENGYNLKIKDRNRRIYSKGNRLIMAPAHLEIRKQNSRVTLEAWVSADMFLIMSLLKGKKPEAGIESGGMTATIPRKRARIAVNRLLEKLGQGPIL